MSAASTKMTHVPEYGYVMPPMPLLSISSPETIQKCASLPLRPDDIFICSYPKSGTTWMQHIVLSLLFQHQQRHQTGGDSTTNSDDDAPFYSHVSEYAPFFEIDPHWNSHNDDLVSWIQENHAWIGRRIFNTHLRFDMLPKPPPTQSSSSSSQPSSSPSASQQQHHQQQEIQGSEQDKIARIQTPPSCCFGKFIYIVRSPLDACVSFYHHLSHQVQGGYNNSLDDFFQEWLLGDTIPFGSWLDHVQSYTTSTATAATATSISSVSPSSSSMKAAVGKDDNNTGKDTTTAVATAFTNGNINSRRVVRLDDGREFFFVTYEEMCSSLPAVVTDLRDFLDLAVTTNDDDELLRTFSFAYMKANRERFQPKSVQWKNNFSFLRKGVPGDSAMVVTKEQQEQFQTVLKKSPLWQRLMDEKEEEPPNETNNNAVQLLLSKIKGLLVTAQIR